MPKETPPSHKKIMIHKKKKKIKIKITGSGIWDHNKILFISIKKASKITQNFQALLHCLIFIEKDIFFVERRY